MISYFKLNALEVMMVIGETDGPNIVLMGALFHGVRVNRMDMTSRTVQCFGLILLITVPMTSLVTQNCQHLVRTFRYILG